MTYITAYFQTPDGIVVKNLEITPDDGLKTQEYKLDSPIRFVFATTVCVKFPCFSIHTLKKSCFFKRNGIWQIAVKYSNNPYLNYTARFEVKEYGEIFTHLIRDLSCSHVK